MLGAPGGVDPQELAALTRELEVSGYHTYLRTYVEGRIANLLVDDVTDPYVAMKRRGQVEELQRLVVPLFVKTLALAALARRAEARATAAATADAGPGAMMRRDWWSDPVDELPVP
jgi:hypothetical protein